MTSFLLLLVITSLIGLCGGGRLRRGTDETGNLFGGSLSEFVTDVGPGEEADLVVIMDRSQGMGRHDFYLKARSMVSMLLRRYAVLHPDYTRLAVITFAGDTTKPIDYISQDSARCIKGEIFYSQQAPFDDVVYVMDEDILSSTNLKGAFEMAEEVLAAGKTIRPDAKQLMVVLTDGSYKENEDPFAVVEKLTLQNGVKSYAFGIGNWLRRGNVRELATSSMFYGEYEDFDALMRDYPRSWEDDMKPLWIRSDDYLCGNTTSCEHAACFSDVLSGRAECLCQPGYTPAGAECKECLWHKYKPVYGNEACTICPPAYVTAAEGAVNRSECECSEYANATCSNQAGDINLDPCLTADCNSHQICVNYVNYTLCKCQDGFTGSDCEFNDNECRDASVCQNGGTCMDGVDEFQCSCSEGYMGAYCEIDINDCVGPMCDNNGTCTDKTRNFECTCSYPYTGQHCQNEDYTTIPTVPPPTPEAAVATEGMDEDMIYIIAGAGGGCVLIIIIISIIVCVIMNKRRKKALKEAENAKEELNTLRRNRDKSTVSRYRRTITATISNAFSGFWKRKSVNNEHFDYDTSKTTGMPSAPPKHRPDLLHGSEAINHVEELEMQQQQYATAQQVDNGMQGWQSYLNDLKSSDIIYSGLIGDVDDDTRHAATANFAFNAAEQHVMHDILLNKTVHSVINIQGHDFFIYENDSRLAHANCSELSLPQVAYMGRTKRFIILLLALDDGAHCVPVRKELDWMMDHITGEGY